MPTACEHVAEEIRTRILRGDWAPGSKLPERGLLAGQLDSSLVTVQQAVKQMVSEGFLTVGARKHGTRVSLSPPHLSRFRLIFPSSPEHFGGLWSGLASAAERRCTENQQFLPFYGLGGHRDIEEYQAIVDEVVNNQVAGLIFTSTADEFAGTPLLEQLGVARSAMAGQGYLAGIPKVDPDFTSFAQQALDHLTALGRRRIAILCESSAVHIHRLMLDLLAERGLEPPSMWQQFADWRNPLGSAHVMALLFSSEPSKRPDGLIVTDDNLLPAAAEGIRSTAVTPDDLTVVGIANFPHLPVADFPIHRIGFDMPSLLDLLVGRLGDDVTSRHYQDVIVLPAITECEFQTRYTDTRGAR